MSPLRLLYLAFDYKRLTLVPGSSLKIQTSRRKLTLDEQFTESARLEAEIRKNMQRLGFEVKI